MIPELGSFALMLALVVSLVQGSLPVVGAHRGNAQWIALARPAAHCLFLLVLIAFACLMQSFLANDFSVLYVAKNSNAQLPELYRAAAVWGGHEGSLLLWVLMLTGWTFAVSVFSRQLPEAMAARVLGVLGLVTAGFLAFILLTSNPFDRLLPAAQDGQDLNPLLQDPGLIFHPPMLYMGYVGFSVAFAFAIAALLAGRLDVAWARWSRPWTTVAWLFLTLGIALGSYWAYYELGWGGWWFWDPVENASFMPWLVGTALIHSLAVTEKRGSFKNWTVLLAISAFSLSLLGTFLVRSGVLTSVHAFATDPRRGIFILIFLTLTIGSALMLFAWRAPRIKVGGAFSMVSRETMLLVNNVLLASAAGAVLLGTLYPLIIDALGLGKLSVGPPYFNTVFVPLMVPLLFLISVGPLTRWKHATVHDLALRLRWAAVVALLVGAALPFALGSWLWTAALGLALAVWIIVSTALQIAERMKSPSIPLSFWGMHLAHLGVAAMVVGITIVQGYQVERDVPLNPGDQVTMAGYTFTFKGVTERQGPNYRSLRGSVELARDGQVLRTMHPEKRRYNSSSMPMTEAAIDAGFTRDVYVSLGEPLDRNRVDGAWSVRVYYKPWVNWIWIGALMMAAGALLAAADRRYRRERRREVPQGAVA